MKYLSQIVQESVESIMDSKPIKFLTGLHFQMITTRGYSQWEGETVKDVVEKTIISSQISLLETVKKEVETYKSYYNPVGDERNKGKHIAMADLSTYLQDQITKCKELMK